MRSSELLSLDPVREDLRPSRKSSEEPLDLVSSRSGSKKTKIEQWYIEWQLEDLQRSEQHQIEQEWKKKKDLLAVTLECRKER